MERESGETGPRQSSPDEPPGPKRAPKPPPVRIDPPAEVEEMGGEQPCQAHQFWDLEDD